jgi:TM2 domain-containing membrane protein YozV
MKKIFMLTLVGAMLMSFSSMASGSEKYRISDESVEALFATATDVTTTLTSAVSFNSFGTDAVLAEKNAWVAFALAFLVGWTGAHRVYMGSKPILIFGYIITCGGIGGLVPFIDWIVILINNDDISKYIGNNKFFMW